MSMLLFYIIYLYIELHYFIPIGLAQPNYSKEIHIKIYVSESTISNIYSKTSYIIM